MIDDPYAKGGLVRFKPTAAVLGPRYSAQEFLNRR